MSGTRVGVLNRRRTTRPPATKETSTEEGHQCGGGVAVRSIYLGGSLFEVGLDLLVLGLPGFFLLRTLPDLDVPGKECRDIYVRRTCPSGGFVRMTTIRGVLLVLFAWSRPYRLFAESQGGARFKLQGYGRKSASEHGRVSHLLLSI